MKTCAWFAAVFLAAVTANAVSVVEWNSRFLAAIQAETTPPPLASRNLAIFHLALDRAAAQFEESTAAIAVDAAAVAVGTALYPAHAARFGEAAAVDVVISRTAREIAAQVLQGRASDGASKSISYIPSAAPGQWRRTPPFFRPPELPHWCDVQTFAIGKCDAFFPPPPPTLTSAEWVADFNEVKSRGAAASTTRTKDQTEAARFWSDFSYTVTPPGHWNRIAAACIAERRLSTREVTRLFAQLNVAMADAAIVCWHSKYRFNFWRPVTSISRADEDGNPATDPDAQWMPLLNTPAHPEYLSGHSVFSGAAAEVLRRVLGSDQCEFVATSDTLRTTRRRFSSFSAAAAEISNSRVWGGIHFRSAVAQGEETGKKVAAFVMEHWARRGDPLNAGKVRRRPPDKDGGKMPPLLGSGPRATHY